MDKALILISLQKEALASSGQEECSFIITNKTHQLVPYDQAIFFSASDGEAKALSVSGNASIDPKGTHTHIIETLIKNEISNTESSVIQIHSEKGIPSEYQAAWKNFAAPHNVICAFSTKEEGLLGCLLIQRSKKFTDAEMSILEELSSTYAAALAIQILRKNKGLKLFSGVGARYRKWIYTALILLFFLPVKMTVNAPAEIVAQESKMVSAPFDGRIDDVLVKPGDTIAVGQALIKMDQDDLISKERSAAQNLELAQVTLSRVRREALSIPEKKAELNRLQAEIKTKQIEHEYARRLLEESEIISPQNGVAVFSDVNMLEGKPVYTGDELMLIANPVGKELLIRIPVDAMLDLDNNAALSFSPNVSPLRSFDGKVISMGYQSSADPDGLLTYKVRAVLDGDSDLRIGWKGSAKIYDDWSILGYAILRRPIIAIRNILGV